MSTLVPTFTLNADDHLCITARGDDESPRLYDYAGPFVEWMLTVDRRWTEFDFEVLRVTTTGRPNPGRLSVIKGLRTLQRDINAQRPALTRHAL